MALENWSFGKPSKGLPWPKGDQGEPVPPAFLTHLSAVDLEGQIAISLLESAGIPVVIQHPNGGDFGKIILGFSGTGLDIYVPVTLLEDAQGLLEGEFEDVDLGAGEFEEDDLV